MSDPEVNKNLTKGRDIIQVSGRVGHLTSYNSSKSLESATELLIKFLASVMTKDYEAALKYCTEILNREPNNVTALEFYPLIVEKLEMLKNEEVENTSSESSLSSSSGSSSSSEENLFRNEFLCRESHQKWSENYANQVENMPVEEIENTAASNLSASEAKEAKNGYHKIQESEISLHAKPREMSINSVDSYKNITEKGTLSPNLLIHPTQTITLISNSASNMGMTTLPEPKQEMQTPNVSQKQPSNLLLHTTRTITFKKRRPLPNFSRTGNPQ